MAGGIGPFTGSGAPVAGVNEVQTLTFGGSGAGATFELSFRNSTTAPISWSATNATLVANILAALQLLPTIATGGVSVAVGTAVAGIGTILVTFLGVNANLDVPMLGVSNVTLALTLAATESTKGVPGTARGALAGATYVDTLNGDIYINDGTNHSPNWVMMGLRKVKVPLGVSNSAGGILAWKNPEPVTIFVIRFIVNLTTKATGACTADFGTAANGTTKDDTLLDGVDLGTAAGVFDNYLNHGTNGLSMIPIPAGNYLTGSQDTGSAVGLVGQAHIVYVRA